MVRLVMRWKFTSTQKLIFSFMVSRWTCLETWCLYAKSLSKHSFIVCLVLSNISCTQKNQIFISIIY